MSKGIWSKITFYMPLVMMIPFGYYLYLNAKNAEILVSQVEVGTVKAIKVNSNTIFDTTLITTTKGFYTVEGVYNAAMDVEAVVETRKNNNQYFCLKDNPCVMIVE